VKYRLNDGRIEVSGVGMDWIPSAHNEATVDEIPEYEKSHPELAVLLKQKHGFTAA
jgi:hypothetical protein